MDYRVTEHNLYIGANRSYPTIKRHSAWGTLEHSFVRVFDLKIKEDFSKLIVGICAFTGVLVKSVMTLLSCIPPVSDGMYRGVRYSCYHFDAPSSNRSLSTSTPASLNKNMDQAAEEYKRLCARKRRSND